MAFRNGHLAAGAVFSGPLLGYRDKPAYYRQRGGARRGTAVPKKVLGHDKPRLRAEAQPGDQQGKEKSTMLQIEIGT